MARKRKTIKKRVAAPDPLHGNRTIAKIINRIMRDGKKSTAQAQIYQALEVISAKGQEPVRALEDAVAKVGPRMEVKARRIGGASYQVPTEVRGDRRVSLAIRWIVEAARKRSNKEFHSFAEKLAAEIMDVAQEQGEAIRKRNTIHKMAEANKAFAHFRW